MSEARRPRLRSNSARSAAARLQRGSQGPIVWAAAELLFQVISRAYERLSLIAATNLPFESWVDIFGGERLTAALPDRLTHRVRTIEANGPSYRLRRSKRRLQKPGLKSDDDDSRPNWLVR